MMKCDLCGHPVQLVKTAGGREITVNLVQALVYVPNIAAVVWAQLLHTETCTDTRQPKIYPARPEDFPK